MATFAIAAAVLVLGSYLILGAITVCSYLRSDRYPPEAAEAPKGDDVMALADALRSAAVPLVDSKHAMCDGPCCREERLDRLVAEFDWPRYATWLKEPS